MAYVVTATWTAKEGEVERVLAAIRKLVEPSRAEPGCRFYQSRCPLLEPRGSTAQRLSGAPGSLRPCGIAPIWPRVIG